MPPTLLYKAQYKEMQSLHIEIAAAAGIVMVAYDQIHYLTRSLFGGYQSFDVAAK